MSDGAQPGATGAPPVVALFGATALGKTEVALALAERLGAEVVVADSMQVYRGLPILTNQPDASQRRRVPIRLTGVLDPSAESSVASYAELAHAAIDDALARGVRVVVEGGSGLYLRAALGTLRFAAPPDAALRADLEARWARDPEGVVTELRTLDPDTVATLDLANPRRVIRALEAVRVLGRALDAGERGALWRPGERYAHQLVALQPECDTLRARIDDRVTAMLAAGVLDEVRRAREAGPLSRTVRQAIGVRELLAVLDGQSTLEAAAVSMRRRTHALVRRQLTWMRKLPEASVVPMARLTPDAAAAAVLRHLGDG